MKQRNLLLMGVGALLLAAAPAQGATTDSRLFSPDPLQWSPKAKGELPFKNKEEVKNAILFRAQAKQTVIPECDEIGFLDGPDGSLWYFTGELTTDLVDHDGIWTESLISGFRYTIYDNNFQVVTTIEDDIALREGETKIAQVQLGAAVTKKFFNVNDKPEFMVMIVANTERYVNNIYTKVYSQDATEPVCEMEGYYIDAVNCATDSWSEDFYITFTNESETLTPEINGVLNVSDYIFTTYKKAGWNPGNEAINEARLPMVLIGSPDAIPFVTTKHGKDLYITLNHLKYSFFEDPYDYENENLTQDNRFVVKTWKYDRYNLTEVTDLEIATENSGSEYEPFRFYNVGLFRYGDDVTFGIYDNSNLPCYVVTEQVYQSMGDDFTYDYSIYDHTGKKLMVLADNVDLVIFLSDVNGFGPQAAFVKNASASPIFDLIDYQTGKRVTSLPYAIDNDIFLNDSLDRVSDGKGGYLYVVSQYYADVDDENNAIQSVAYITPEGEIDHIDRLNLGQNIELADVYVSGQALSPYLFNTDDLREYMVLVKRRVGAESSLSKTELLVINEKSETLLHLTPSEEYGEIINIWINPGDDVNASNLMVIYDREDENYQDHYNTVVYDLPLYTFAKGTGTAEDPYQISSYGEFRQIGSDLDAHYVLTADIDASISPLTTFKGAFRGTLDGRGHIIRNLTITGEGIFSEIQSANEAEVPEMLKGGEVSNITFISPKVVSDNQGGVIAGASVGGKITNVHVYKGELTGSEDYAMGGLLGEAMLFTRVSNSSFDGKITNAKGETGGIAGNSYTGSVFSNCAVSGTIYGGGIAGGVVGNFQDGNSTISDCHVNAEISAVTTVGGVAGYSKRGLISRCHVQGILEARSGSQWETFGKVGGIVGELWADWQNRDNADAPVVIRDCFVNLTSIISFSDGKNGKSATHRIVGYTSIDDGDADTPGYHEDYLRNNYAISTMWIFNPEAEGADETEGASIEEGDLTKEFFAETLGFVFGDNTEAPWSEANPQAPSLWYETVVVVADPTALEVEIDKSETVTFQLLGVEEITADTEYACSIADEEIAEISDAAISGNTLTVTIKGKKVGDTTLNVTIGGQQATVGVTVKWPTGIEETESASALRYAGDEVVAEGAEIVVYNLSGVAVGAGRDRVSLRDLPAGIYVAVASGRTLKVRR